MAWFALSVGAIAALGEGQEPESASGEARGGGGLGAVKPVQNEFARCYYSDKWHSFLHPFLRSLLSLLAYALWDLACSRSPQFLEATRI
jgi:hypothetical protein